MYTVGVVDSSFVVAKRSSVLEHQWVKLKRNLYYVNYWTEAEWSPVQRVEAFSFGKTVHKFTDHINASARNALQILWQCKCKYSYTSVVSILYIYVSLDLVLLHIIKQLVIFCLLYIN